MRHKFTKPAEPAGQETAKEKPDSGQDWGDSDTESIEVGKEETEVGKSDLPRVPTPMPTPTKSTKKNMPTPTKRNWGDLQEEKGWVEWRKGRIKNDGTFNRYPKQRYWYRESGVWKKSSPKRQKKLPIARTENDYVKFKERHERTKRILEDS